ncbi:hypothetical protein Tco_0364808 [Tanacetum coccineum]
MVAYLEKSPGSAGFHQIIDFINRSHICYALTKKPEVCVSFIKQFWRTAAIVTEDNGNVKIHATVDGHSLSITEGSIRRHLKLDDQDGLISLPTSEIFAQLALMGYVTDSDKLTFQKGAFSPQWRFLIHLILHCLSPKKTAWEQFSSNIAAAVICLATNRRDTSTNNTKKSLVPSLTMKVFSNMKRSTKGFSGQEVPLFSTMLDAAESSPSRSTSSPSPTPTSSPTPESTHTQPSPQPPTPQPSPTQPSPTHLGSEYHPPTPHDSPLHAVHSHGSDEGRLKLQELMNLINILSDRVGVLEADLTKTKQTYSSAYTKLILRVKKLEAQIKVGKARRHSRFVLSDTEGVEDDSSKQGRKFSNEGFKDDEGVHEKASTETELFIQEITPTEVIHEQEGSGKASDEISTAGKKKDTASEEVPPVSTAEVHISTAGETATYSRRSAEKRKDKGKGIMTDEEPKKKSKKELEQERLSFAEAIRIEEQMHEEQRAQIARDAEIARQWEEEEKKKAMDEAESTKKIDWNDPSVLRYHSLKMKPKGDVGLSVKEGRRERVRGGDGDVIREGAVGARSVDVFATSLSEAGGCWIFCRRIIGDNPKEEYGHLLVMEARRSSIKENRECRVPRSKENRNWNQASSSKAVRIEDASEKAMCAIDGGGFDWSDMAVEFKLDITDFKASTNDKRGLSILEAQVVKYKESEVLFSEEIALLKRSVGHKDYLMGLVKTELEKVKEEKEGVEFKLAKFEKSSKDLDDLLASQVTDKSKKGFGYHAVPSPHPLILNRPTPLDLSYSGLEEFQQPEINWYGPRDSSSKPTTVCNRESNNSKENIDDSLTQKPKSGTETSSAVPTLKVDTKWKEKFFNNANNVRLEEPKKARENTDAPIVTPPNWVAAE